MKLLVISNRQLVLAAAARHASELGLALLQCQGVLAMPALFEQAPEVVLLDAEFESDAISLCRMTRELETETHAVLIALAGSATGEIEALLSAGADDVMATPVEGAQLLAHLQVALRRARERLARRRARKALVESERRARRRLAELTHIYKTVPVGLCQLDAELKIVRINGLMADLLGRPSAENIGRRLGELAPGLSARIDSVCRQALASGEPIFDEEIRWRTPVSAKTDRYALLSCFPVAPREGHVTGVSVVVHEITDRKHAEQALHESKERLRSILENNPCFILMFDREMRIQYINRLQPEYTMEQVIGQPAAAFLRSPYREEQARICKQIFETGEPGEMQAQDREGRHYLSRLVPLSANGQVVSILCVATDVTQLKAVEAGWKLSEDRFRTICEQFPVLIDSFDAQGRCVLWSRECERRLGYTEDEIRRCAKPLALFYPDPAIQREILENIEQGDGVFREYHPLAKDGSPRVQLWANFRLADGTVISAGIDITEARQLEERLAIRGS
ncbi:MAG: PAS domain-containing protein [Planctomycetota bacterium]|nr:PAS domain-containing protein [Planctomycetota bacterium]